MRFFLFSCFGCEGRRARKGTGSRGVGARCLFLFLCSKSWLRGRGCGYSPGGRLRVKDPREVVDRDAWGVRSMNLRWEQRYLCCCNWQRRERTRAGREVGLNQPTCCLPTLQPRAPSSGIKVTKCQGPPSPMRPCAKRRPAPEDDS